MEAILSWGRSFSNGAIAIDRISPCYVFINRILETICRIVEGLIEKLKRW